MTYKGSDFVISQQSGGIPFALDYIRKENSLGDELVPGAVQG